jgi:hypothetical protein
MRAKRVTFLAAAVALGLRGGLSADSLGDSHRPVRPDTLIGGLRMRHAVALTTERWIAGSTWKEE